MKVERVIENSSGNILVRFNDELKHTCGIVEILHLWHDNKSGCAIAGYYIDEVNNAPYPELREIQDRLTSTDFDDGVLEQALQCGREIANFAIKYLYKEDMKENKTEGRDCPINPIPIDNVKPNFRRM